MKTLLLLTTVLVACGSPSALPTSPAVRPPGATRCENADTVLVSAINTGLDPGVEIRDANALQVRSDDFEQAYFVSSDLAGPGLEGPDDIATWVLDGTGSIYSVSALAEQFSDFGPGSLTDAEFSMSDDGAQESATCAGP